MEWPLKFFSRCFCRHIFISTGVFFPPQLDSSNIHPLIVLNADALSFASQLFIGTETNITINKESLMHFLFYEKLFMDFEIQSVSDLFSILFKMEGQTDLEIATSKDLANLSEDSDKPALSLSFADQTWFELSSDCSDEEKEQMIKAACDIPINKSLHKKDRCGNISLPASVSFYPMLFSTHEFPMAAHPDHGKMSFSFRYNHPGVPALFQFLSHSILLLFHLHSQL